ncbi:protein TIME FOR COFFEE isoform X3 [Amaranthus tricolor]|uniref:protein TIME FOR COFFEE isoform X3 n=1 Tax=Amaranthus tricolor TaxID=29722 RepID=UPI0025836DD9|nr:protein TIME FOR COFFEE isoform X3 [Amaranthus tricolor]
MMDRNREARRTAAIVNGLPRRRHRTTTGGSLRESPDDVSPMELQETAARLRDRPGKKDRDRDLRERDRDRERERDRLGTKRRRGDKYSRNKEDGGVDDDSSEESINDEEDEDDDGRLRYIPPANQIPMSSSPAASNLTSHRKSYPPPSKAFRVAPTWKASDEMIGVPIPRKARSVSTKRGHDWSSAAVGEQIHRQPSSSPVSLAAAGTTTVPLPSQGPHMSPSSSTVSIKKKIKANGPPKQRPPKFASKSSSPTTQDEIEIAEVLYGLKRQSQAPSKQDGMMPNDSAKLDSRSVVDSKSRISSPVPNSSSASGLANNSSSSTPPLTTIAPKRKRPRPYPEEIPGGLGPRSSPVSSAAKAEVDQASKPEVASPNTEKNLGSTIQNGGDLANSQEHTAETIPSAVGNTSVIQSDTKPNLVEESKGIRNGVVRAKVEEASSTPKLESAQNHDRVESSTTSTKPTSSPVEPENHKEEKFEIDLMAPPPQSRTSPEREEEMAENGGAGEKPMVMDRKAEANPKEDDNKVNGGDVESHLALGGKCESTDRKEKQTTIDLQLDLQKFSVNDDKLNSHKQQPSPPKINRDDYTNNTNKHGGQSGSAPLAMSVPGVYGGLAPPMGYVGPLQGVVSMDGTPMASPPIQTPPFMFSRQQPKRCTTHCDVAKSISMHQRVMKMNTFWPAAAAAPIFGAKPYNLNMVPSDNKGQPFTYFPGQPAASSKDKSQTPNVPDSSQKKQFLLQPVLPPGAPPNTILAPALFFPVNQQQPAVANVRPSSAKSPSTVGSAPSNSVSTSGPMGTPAALNASTPTMSFSYPNMGRNETQYMTILGNGAYPYPMTAHVGAAPPYMGGSHPQAMSFFDGSFYSSQMLHPSQLQQGAPSSQSLPIQQQSQQNASLSTSSSSSQKHMQSQQIRPHGSSIPSAGNLNQGLQNFQATTKARTSQLHHEMGSEDSPSADSRTRPNTSVYGQNFAMPFHSPNFALITPPTSMGGAGGGGNNAAGVSNGNLGDKQQQQAQQTHTFPMSFAAPNGATAPGFDICSMAYNPAILQSIPEAALQNYKKMAAAAAVAAASQAAQQKNSYRGPEDGKAGSAAATDSSNMNEERKTMAARASAATVGQSIAFSRDVSDNSVSSMVGNNVVDSSARSLNNLSHGSSARPSRSSVPTSVSNSNASNPQHPQQMLFPKQQQYVVPNASGGRSKIPSTTNGNVYPDHITSSPVMVSKFPNSLSGFSTLVQTSGGPVQSPQLKNITRPNTSQVSSPSASTSMASNTKNLPQQQGRSQQNHTQISFGATAANPKPSSTSQGQQAQNNNQAPSSPMLVGSPSTSSVSKGASGSPRNTPSGNKAGAQGSTLPSQSGRNSQSPSMSTQKPSIFGNLQIMLNSTSGGKSHLQPSQQRALSMQSIQQTQLYFNNPFVQASASTSAAMAGGGYHPQKHRQDGQQQHQQGSKSQASVPITPSSAMMSSCALVSQANTSTSDPAKAVSTTTAAAAAAGANSMKDGVSSQGIFHAAQFASQPAGAPSLLPAGFPYVHAVSTAVQVKSAEQKQPAGE